MSWRTDGIQVAAPVQWRQLDGMVTVLWEAESQAGASGYYLADDPRIMFFFNDVSSHVRISNRNNDFARSSRSMARAVYVPAGVPMWTSSKSAHRFSHLNLHLHKDRALRYLTPVDRQFGGAGGDPAVQSSFRTLRRSKRWRN